MMEFRPKPPPDSENLPRLPYRPDSRGFRWDIDPADGVEIPSAMIAIAEAMRAVLSPNEIAMLGPRLLQYRSAERQRIFLHREHIEEAS